MEIWKEIKGYENNYEISNFGRIKSKERIFIRKKDSKPYHKKERILSPGDNGKGYKFVYLVVNKSKKHQYLHRLVALHFIENNENKEYVNHKDGDKTNNHVEPLRKILIMLLKMG